MTPEKKAKELFSLFKGEQPKYSTEDDDEFEEEKRERYFARRCALICVGEILDDTPMYSGNLNPKWEFWNDVKNELEKIKP